MSRRERFREALAAATADTPSAGKGRQVMAAYKDWCEANGQPVYPPTGVSAEQVEQMLMRYLFSNFSSRGWGEERFVEVSRFIAYAFVAAGHPDPRRDNWCGLRDVVARERPGNGEQLVAPLTEAEVLEMVEAVAVAGVPEPMEAQAAAVLALADVLGWESNPTQQAIQGLSLPGEAFQLREDDIVLTTGEGRRVLVDRETQPHHYGAIAPVLERAGDAAYPVQEVAPHPGRTNPQARAELVRELRQALSRADQSVARGAASAALVPAWEAWWEQADAEERVWLIANAEDRKLAQSRQDLAYFFTGLASASRHAELSRLKVGGWTQTPEGYGTQLASHEHKGGMLALGRGEVAEPLDIFVPHLDDGCAPHCPACRLSDHLEVRRRRHGAQAQDPLFVWPGRRYSSGAAQPLSSVAGGHLMNRLWDKVCAHLDYPEEGRKRRIGTKTIRVTAATIARLRGMELADIAALLNHRQASTTVRYIAINDEYAEADLVLTEAPPERPTYR